VANKSFYRSLYWLPSLSPEPNHKVSESVRNRTYTLDLSTEWIYSNPAGSVCSGCASLYSESTLKVTQPSHRFGLFSLYPFDHHTITLRLRSNDDATLFNCAGDYQPTMTLDEIRSAILPTSGEWILYKRPQLNQITEAECEFSMEVSRNYFTRLLKSVVITALITFVGLLSLFLHLADHTGDRCAGLLVAILILITMFQTDVGLGTITYLIWEDYLNLSQVVVLLVGLLETMAVHFLWHFSKQESFASNIDFHCKIALICFVYPITLTSMFLAAAELSVVAVVILSITMPIIVLVTFYRIWVTEQKKAKVKRRVLKQLSSLSPDDPRYEGLLRQAFDVFDEDGTGDIDAQELRELFRSMWPTMERGVMAKAIQCCRKYANSEGRVTFEDLLDGLVEISHELQADMASLPVYAPKQPSESPTWQKEAEQFGAKGWRLWQRTVRASRILPSNH